MRALLIVLTLTLTLALNGCIATGESLDDYFWEPEASGCRDRSIFDIAIHMDPTDVMFRRRPDRGNRQSIAIYYQNHVTLFDSLESVPPPQLIIAYGGGDRTCVHRIEQTTCPAASDVYDRLLSIQMSPGYMRENPWGRIVMHADGYEIVAKDGYSNRIEWSSQLGGGDPFKNVIDQSLDHLESCITPARKMFEAAQENPREQ